MVRQPAVNGIEVVEHREYMTVTIVTPFPDPEDLMIADEIITSALLDLSGSLNVKIKSSPNSLELSFSMCVCMREYIELHSF